MQTMTMPTWETLTLSQTSDDGSLEITGRAIPYGEEITQAGERIRFSAGSIDTDTLAGRPLLWEHINGEVIGTVLDAHAQDDGVYMSARILPTSRGRDVITLVKSHAVSGLSIGFTPEKSERTGGEVRDYKAVRVHEISITPTPAFSTARIQTFAKEPDMADHDTAHTPDTAAEVTELRAQLVELSERVEASRVVDTPAQTLSAPQVLTHAIADYAQTRRTLALADTVSSGNAGMLPPVWASEVRRYVDAYRPLINVSGKMPFPATGHSIDVPKVLTGLTVGARGTEKTSVPSSSLTTGVDQFAANWAAGGADVSLELLQQSGPGSGIAELVAMELLERYAAHSESVHVANAEAAATATGAPLNTTSYGDLVGDLVATSVAIRAATGMPGDILAATSEDWIAILSLVDSDNRRVFATNGGTNADGSAALTAEMIQIGGITVVHSAASSVTIQTNVKSLRVAERVPQQLSENRVELMGRDFGILGAIITLPLYPAGIQAYQVAAP